MKLRAMRVVAPVVAVMSSFAIPVSDSLADESCNSPYIRRLIKGQEHYLHVWTLGVKTSATAPTNW